MTAPFRSVPAALLAGTAAMLSGAASLAMFAARTLDPRWRRDAPAATGVDAPPPTPDLPDAGPADPDRDTDLASLTGTEGGEPSAVIAEFDDDGDGVPDTVVVAVDEDGDGTPDAAIAMSELDTDGDGEVDTVVAAIDVDGDGVPDDIVVVSVDDVVGEDPAADAPPDELRVATDEEPASEGVVAALDVDGDGEVDAVVATIDIDGDGLPDDVVVVAEEGFGTDDSALVTGDLTGAAEGDSAGADPTGTFTDGTTGSDGAEALVSDPGLDGATTDPAAAADPITTDVATAAGISAEDITAAVDLAPENGVGTAGDGARDTGDAGDTGSVADAGDTGSLAGAGTGGGMAADVGYGDPEAAADAVPGPTGEPDGATATDDTPAEVDASEFAHTAAGDQDVLADELSPGVIVGDVTPESDPEPPPAADRDEDDDAPARRPETHIAEIAERPVATVVREIADLSTDELEALFEYESTHRKRKTVLQAIERANAPQGA